MRGPALGSRSKHESRARAILEVSPFATEDEIRARYLELVTLYDPQKREYFTQELKRAAEERTHDIVWAYSVLAANEWKTGESRNPREP